MEDYNLLNVKLRFHPIVWMVLLCAAGASADARAANAAEVPEQTTVCDLLKNPATWDHKLVEVTGFVSHGFEDSGVSDPECDSRYSGLWMTYGGKQITQTPSTANEIGPNRKSNLRVEGITVPLVEDDLFRRLDQLLRSKNADGYIEGLVRATVIARFFAKPASGGPLNGFGHMGCCHLFAIQQVLRVQELPDTLDKSDYAAYPKAKSIRFLAGVGATNTTLRMQRQADRNDDADAFANPDRAARQLLETTLGAAAASRISLHRKTFGDFRAVYEGKDLQAKLNYKIVVSRPAWLSFYAKDPTRVIWVVIRAFEYPDEK